MLSSHRKSYSQGPWGTDSDDQERQGDNPKHVVGGLLLLWNYYHSLQNKTNVYYINVLIILKGKSKWNLSLLLYNENIILLLLHISKLCSLREPRVLTTQGQWIYSSTLAEGFWSLQTAGHRMSLDISLESGGLSKVTRVKWQSSLSVKMGVWAMFNSDIHNSLSPSLPSCLKNE